MDNRDHRAWQEIDPVPLLPGLLVLRHKVEYLRRQWAQADLLGLPRLSVQIGSRPPTKES